MYTYIYKLYSYIYSISRLQLWWLIYFAGELEDVSFSQDSNLASYDLASNYWFWKPWTIGRWNIFIYDWFCGIDVENPWFLYSWWRMSYECFFSTSMLVYRRAYKYIRTDNHTQIDILCRYVFFLVQDSHFLLYYHFGLQQVLSISFSRRFQPQPADLTVSRTERFKMDRDKVSGPLCDKPQEEHVLMT